MAIKNRARLYVFRSLKHIYAQILDDEKGITICSCSTLDPEIVKSKQTVNKTEKAKLVGNLIAKKAIEKGVDKVVFDRGKRIYHGRIKALADGARNGGLIF